MANNTFPSNNGPYKLAGAQKVFVDTKFQTRANVLDTNGNPLPGNQVNVPPSGIVPNFQITATVTAGVTSPGVVYLQGDDGNPIPLYPNAHTTTPTVTGSKGANAALTSLMSALAQLGIVVDSTS